MANERPGSPGGGPEQTAVGLPAWVADLLLEADGKGHLDELPATGPDSTARDAVTAAARALAHESENRLRNA